MIDDPGIRAQVLPLLAERLDGLAPGAFALQVDDWWTEVAQARDLVVQATAADRYAAVVAVDALRTTANPTDRVAPGGRLYFVELAEIHGRSTAPALDVTGHLWSLGFSTIDIDRPRLDGPGGSWEFAIGIARHRLLPDPD